MNCAAYFTPRFLALSCLTCTGIGVFVGAIVMAIVDKIKAQRIAAEVRLRKPFDDHIKGRDWPTEWL